MLDKTSERVLSVLIRKCGGDPEKEVTISEKDFIFPKLSLNLLFSICEYLHKNEYIKSHSSLYSTTTELEIVLTYKGLSYFDYKKIAKIEYIKTLSTNSICGILVSIISAILTTILLTA